MSSVPWILGVDLGSGSLGWAALRLDDEQAAGILASGVRVFPAGVSGLERGKDESSAKPRREARLARRQTDRRRRRIQKVYSLLMSYGLLPAARAVERLELVAALDREFSAKYQRHDTLPYFLRARALDERLEPFELGRALFHLAQRRGFLSNRQSTKDTEEDRGKVKQGIQDLDAAMETSGGRTLGEYLSRLDPQKQRIRHRYTARRMYFQEFEQIWSAQERHWPALLTGERKAALMKALFHQRPLKDQSELIGVCELEKGEKRAPVWHPLAQRFRMLQEVNHLRLGIEGQRLELEERELVLRRLQEGDLPLKEFRGLLGIKRNVPVNLDSGGKKALIGNRTEGKMRAAFRHLWDEMGPADRLSAVTMLADGKIEDDSLAAMAEGRWGVNGVMARNYAESTLEYGKYMNLSLKAMEKLLPLLEEGADYATARKEIYPETFRTEVLDALPPVVDQKEIRNPAVVRALTELRKVVNALIRRYGKPAEIHIELARDLKAPKMEREKRWQRMRQNEDERAKAAATILAESWAARPSRADIEKWRLAEECRWRCPYTQQGFSKQQLFNGQVQVEHIIPFSRSLDDSFANKTLAYSAVNACKGNRSPREAFEGSPDWENILTEVKAFQGDYAKHKLERFQWDAERVGSLLDDFTTRQLNDTRYASRLAARYVAALYGGLSDGQGRQRVFVSPGQVTAYLRRLWSIEGLLSGGGKSRDDHRHHLIDAVVVALTGPRWVKELSDAAERAREEGRRRFGSLQTPWLGFVDDVRGALASVVVSHRVNRKVSGAMHDATFYGTIQHPVSGERATVVRKPVHRLSSNEVEQIVDRVVRERVQLQLNILQTEDAKKLEHDPPTLPTRDGRAIPIRKVRIGLAEEPRCIGQGARARLVVGDEYHHFEILRRVNPKNRKVKWDFAAVTTQTAMERVRDKKPVVCGEHGPGTEFVCSIAKGDTLELGPKGARAKYLVLVLEGAGKVRIKPILEARPFEKIADKRGLRPTINVLMTKRQCRKIYVTPLGEVYPAND